MTDTAILRDQLTVLSGTVANRYQPQEFRLALNTGTANLPVWASKGEFNIIDVTADIRLISDFDTSVPLASHKRRSRNFPVYALGTGYRIARDEVLKSNSDPSYALEPSLALANQRKSERVLQQIACYGGAYADLTGILNMPDATTFTPTNHASSHTSWVDTAGLPIAAATYDYILKSLTDWVYAYNATVSGEFTPDRMILSAMQGKALNVRNATTGETVLQRFTAENPGIRVFRWSDADTIGVANQNVNALYSSAADCQEMVIVQELTDLEPVKEPLGAVVVPQILKAGSVISNFPQSISLFTQLRQ